MDFIKDESKRIADIEDESIRDEARQDFARHANRAAVNNLTELASVQLISSSDQFDADKMALAVHNGWIDLNKGQFNYPDPDKLFSLQAAVRFEKHMPASVSVAYSGHFSSSLCQ